MARLHITAAPIRRRDYWKLIRGKFMPNVILEEKFEFDGQWHTLCEAQHLSGRIEEGELNYGRFFWGGV